MAMAVAAPKRIQPSRARRSVVNGVGDDAAVLSAFAPDDRLVARVLPIVLTDDPTVSARAEPLPPTASNAHLADAEELSGPSSLIPVPDCCAYDPGRVPRPRFSGVPDPATAEDTSDAAFERRHFKMERTEKRLRRQEIDRVRADRALLAMRIEQMRETSLDALVPSLEAQKEHEKHALVLFGLAAPEPSNPSTPSAFVTAPSSLDSSDPATEEQLSKLKEDMLRQAEHALERHDALLSVPPPVMGKTAEEEVPERKRLRTSVVITRQARAQRIRVALAAPRPGNSRAPAHVARAQRAVASVRSAALERERQRQRVHMSGRTQLGSQTSAEGKVEVIYQEEGAPNIHARTSGGRFASKPKPGDAPSAPRASSSQASSAPARESAARPVRASTRKKTTTTAKPLAAAKGKGKAASSTTRARPTITFKSTELSAAQVRRAQARAEAHAAAAASNPTSESMRAAAEAAAAKAARKAAELRAQAQTLGQRRTAAATAAAAARAALKRELGLKPGEPIPPDLLAARLQAVRASVSAASAATQPGMPRVVAINSKAPAKAPAPKKAASRSKSTASANTSRSRPRTSSAGTVTLRQRSRVTYNEDTESEEEAEEVSDPQQPESEAESQAGPKTTAAGRPVRAAARKSLPEPTPKKGKARASLPAASASKAAPTRSTRRTRLSEPAPEPEREPEPAPAPTPPTWRVKITLRRNNHVKEETPAVPAAAPAAAPADTAATTSIVSTPAPAPAPAATPAPAPAQTHPPKRGRTSQPAYVPAAITEDEAMAMLQAALADDPDALGLLGAAPAEGDSHATTEPAHTQTVAAPPAPAGTTSTPAPTKPAAPVAAAGSTPAVPTPTLAAKTSDAQKGDSSWMDVDADGEADADGSADEGWTPMKE